MKYLVALQVQVVIMSVVEIVLQFASEDFVNLIRSLSKLLGGRFSHLGASF